MSIHNFLHNNEILQDCSRISKSWPFTDIAQVRNSTQNLPNSLKNRIRAYYTQ